MTTIEASRKINDAALATMFVAGQVDDIRITVDNFPARTNALGVYADPAQVLALLQVVRTAAEAALARLQATPWPSPADYDEV